MMILERSFDVGCSLSQKLKGAKYFAELAKQERVAHGLDPVTTNSSPSGSCVQDIYGPVVKLKV